MGTTDIKQAEPSKAESLKNEMHRVSPGDFEPLFKRVWIERIPPMDMTHGGLAIPDIAQQVLNYAVVLKVASDVDDITEGAIVMVEAYEGQEIDFSGRKCLLVEHDQIKSIIKSPI